MLFLISYKGKITGIHQSTLGKLHGPGEWETLMLPYHLEHRRVCVRACVRVCMCACWGGLHVCIETMSVDTWEEAFSLCLCTLCVCTTLDRDTWMTTGPHPAAWLVNEPTHFDIQVSSNNIGILCKMLLMSKSSLCSKHPKSKAAESEMSAIE